MKKVLLIFMMFFACITTAQAEDVFRKTWETKPYTTEQIEILASRGLEFNNGYIVIDYEAKDDTYYSFINHYDYKGNLIANHQLEEFILLEWQVYEDYIYALVDNIGEIGLIRINKKFEIDKTLYLGDEVQDDLYGMYEQYFAIEQKQKGLNVFNVDKRGIAILLSAPIIVVDLDFEKTPVFLPPAEEYINYYFEEFYFTYFSDESVSDYAKVYANFDSDKNHMIYSGYSIQNCYPSGETCGSDGAILSLKNNNDEEIWVRKYSEYEYFRETKIIGDYIVVVAFENSEVLDSRTILVIDFEGNIVQEISTDNNYYFFEETSRGFIVTEYLFENDLITTDTEVYQFLNNIDTEIEGKGTVTVAKTQEAGKEVIFQVSPQSGYKLDKVIVTDEDGKEIIFKDYTFTMPSSDVKIKAIFVVNNPNTIAKSIILLIIGFAVSAIVYIKNKKRMLWLKQ